MTDEKTCKKSFRTQGVKIVCEPRRLFSYSPYPYGSDEYWKWCERQAADWCREFHDFMRDHRSMDVIGMDVEVDRLAVCSNCGGEWEPIEGRCARCDAVIEVAVSQQDAKP